MNPSGLPLVGLADLVRCLAVLGPEGLERAAELLGYPPAAANRRPRMTTVRVSVGRPELQEVGEGAQPPARSRGRFVYWRCTGWERSRIGPFRPPDWLPEYSKITAGEIESFSPPDGVRPPARQPLAPWPRLAPFLRRALSARMETGEVDARKLVPRLARGEVVRRLPRLRRMVWTARAAVLVDRSDRLMPFWEDQDEVVAYLQRWRGRSGLDVVDVPRGLDRPVWRRGRSKPGWSLPEGSCVPVLVLGDLDCLYRGGPDRAAWLRLGRRLRRRGIAPVALAPCPRERWTRALAGAWRMAVWDRCGRLPVLTGDGRGGGQTRLPGRDLARDEARAAGLLRLVSPARRGVEPRLLRAVRFVLPAARADVGTEADVWNHQGVSGRCREAMTIDADRARAWLEKWPGSDVDAATGERALGLIGEHHRHLSPWATCDERVAIADLSDEKDGEALISIRRAVATQAAEFEPGLERLRYARWMDRLVRRCPDGLLQETGLAYIKWLRAGREDPQAASPPAAAGGPAWVVQLAGAELRAVPGLRSSGTGGGVEGIAVASLRAGDPFALVEVAGIRRPGGAVDGLRPLPGPISVLSGARRVRVETDAELLTFKAFERPPWAEAVGCDSFGLWAEVGVEAGEAGEGGRFVQRLRWIPPGVFMMGSEEGEEGRYTAEGPRHEVAIGEGFWLADTPCTQGFWTAVEEGRNPSHFRGEADSPRRPVEQVSWQEAQSFCRKLGAKLGGTVRLPSEAEWEYACRAGTQTRFWSGDSDGDLARVGWYDANSGDQTHPVGEKETNAFGLYDMHGNVWEWCEDEWHKSYEGAPADGRAWKGESNSGPFVVGGGSWFGDPRYCRSACRDGYVLVDRDYSLGFRWLLSGLP